MLNHNVGRDISKFFFGGYSLEDNERRARGHNHSIYARMIVNELTVAIFERDIPCGTEEVVLANSRAHSVNADTKTIFMCAAKESPNLKHYYEDFRVLGKHFRVSKTNDPNFSRHYTICNVMTPHILQAYKNALAEGTQLPEFAVSEQD